MTIKLEDVIDGTPVEFGVATVAAETYISWCRPIDLWPDVDFRLARGEYDDRIFGPVIK